MILKRSQKELTYVKDMIDRRANKTSRLKKHLEKYRQQNAYFAIKLNFQEYLFEKEFQKRVEQEEKARLSASELDHVKEELSRVPIIKVELRSKIERLENQLLCVMWRFKEIEKEVIDLKESERYLKDEISMFISENKEYKGIIEKYEEEATNRYDRDEEILTEINELAECMKDDDSNGKVIVDNLKFKLEESIIDFVSS